MKYIKKYDNFIFENMDQSKSIYNRKMGEYEKLKSLLSKNMGYIGKFTEFLFKGVSYDELETLLDELTKLKKLSHPIKINDMSHEEILDNIQSTKEKIQINSFIKEFPNKQKSFIKEKINDDNIKNIILKIVNKKNIESFVSKVSRYHTSEDLISAMGIFSKDPMNDKTSILNSINSLKDTIVVYDSNNLLILLVDSQEDIIKLGSDTSWCIVGSSYQWKNYTDNGKNGQFILYNFNIPEYHPKFKIGFTIKYPTDVLSHAHDILDKGSISEVREILSNYNITPEFLNKTKHDQFKSNVENIKLGSSLSMAGWKLVIPTLTKENAVIWLRKFLTWKKTDVTRMGVIRSFLNHILSEYSYTTRDDLKEIDDELLSYTTCASNFVDTSDMSSVYNTNLFKKIWEDGNFSDQVILNTISVYYFMSHFTSDSRKSEVITDEKFIKNVFDKLNTLYNSSEYIKWKENNHKKDHPKLNSLPICLVVLSKILNIDKSHIKEYDKIISENINTLSEFNYLMKMNIDLEKNTSLSNINSKEDISFLIKKDYDNINLYLKSTYHYSYYTLGDKLSDLLDHLKSNNITFLISPTIIDKYKPNNSLSLPDVLNKVLSEMKKLKDNRKLKNGDIVSDGNVHIKYQVSK